MVRQARTKLNQRQARVVQRWYIEGWSAAEIAAETRLAVNHIYVLKHRALKKLRAYCASAERRPHFTSLARKATRRGLTPLSVNPSLLTSFDRRLQITLACCQPGHTRSQGFAAGELVAQAASTKPQGLTRVAKRP